MIFNMVGGGGGKLFAIIAVTYPEGSICTCVSGTKTLKAKDTSGSYTFTVPNTGTWTISATNGDKETSTTVEITTEGQVVSVELSFLVPSEYQAVEYLESTGTQYIETNIGKSDYLWRCRAEVKAYCSDNTTTLLGSGRSGTPYFILWSDGRPYKTFEGGVVGNTMAANAIHELVFVGGTSSQYATVDGTRNGSTTYTQTAYSAYGIYLFAMNSGGDVTRHFKGRLYSLKFYAENHTDLIADFVPCYRKSDSKAGLWDRVSKTFYTNNGSGTFTVGADI